MRGTSPGCVGVRELPRRAIRAGRHSRWLSVVRSSTEAYGVIIDDLFRPYHSDRIALDSEPDN